MTNNENAAVTDVELEEKEKLASYIGKVYKGARKRKDIIEYADCVRENQIAYDRDQRMIRIVDRVLEDCTPETRLIIRKEFLESSSAQWYLDYFSKTTYYRLRRKAVAEFYKAMNF